MEKTVCTECGTENGQEYKYCKNCGSALIRRNENLNQPEFIGEPVRKSGHNPHPNSAEGYSNEYRYEPYKAPEQEPQGSNGQAHPAYLIDGVPAEEISSYIGKESPKIMPKFIKMELTRSKTSWCWPPAILCFLFGPLGGALWFLYRKMYKIALVMIAAGVLLTVCGKALTYDVQIDYSAMFDEAFQQGDISGIFNSITNIPAADMLRTSIASFLQQTVNIAFMVITGIFGYYFYKKLAVRKIVAYRSSQVDPRYYRIGLASVGGTSGGMLAVGIILLISVPNIINYIWIYISSII